MDLAEQICRDASGRSLGLDPQNFGTHVVLGHALPALVHDAEVVLRVGIALVRRLAIPPLLTEFAIDASMH